MHIIECSSDVCSYDLEAVQLNLHGRFRRIDVNDTHAVEVFALLNGLARASVELERLLAIKSSQIYMPELPIGPGAVERQPADAAQELRHRLGLGPSPLTEMVSLLEHALGEIGRAACRARLCQSVWIAGWAVSLKETK